MNVEQYQVIADPQTKPTRLDCESTCCYRLHPPQAFNATQPDHLTKDRRLS